MKKAVSWRTLVALDPKVKRTWEDLQSRSDQPVNAIGMPIHDHDKNTLRVWKEEGIDKFLKPKGS